MTIPQFFFREIFFIFLEKNREPEVKFWFPENIQSMQRFSGGPAIWANFLILIDFPAFLWLKFKGTVKNSEIPRNMILPQIAICFKPFSISYLRPYLKRADFRF